MLVSVRLDPKTRTLVDQLARRRGTTKSAILREAVTVLAEREQRAENTPGPYRGLVHLIGCFDSGGKRLSDRTGERFAAIVREKRRARGAR